MRRYGARLDPALILVALYPPNALGAVADFDRWVAAGQPERFDLWRAQRNRDDPLAPVRRALRRSYLLSGVYFGDQEGHTLELRGRRTDPLAAAEVAGVAPVARAGAPQFERIIELRYPPAAARRRRRRAAPGGAVPVHWEALEPLLERPVPALVAPFAARFDELGIHHLDLTPMLRRRSAGGERLFFEIDVHPNVAGYRVIGEVIAEHLTHYVLN